jgi:DNA-binding Lrp family transcriptional regulator
MKQVELRLISELMKNSRRSDRQLSKAIGVSQPTISRMIKRLEKEGYINGYTMVPNFSKIGFEILAFTFAKLKHPFAPEDLERARRDVHEFLNRENAPVILGMSGMGCGADRVLVSFHEDYSTYFGFMNFIKSHPLVEVDGVKSFLVNLVDEKHFLPLNFTGIAGHIQKSKTLSAKTERP